MTQHWHDLHRTARDCAEHGWPIVPGTYQLRTEPTWLGTNGSWAFGLEPITTRWAAGITTDPTSTNRWWNHQPYSLLLNCGDTVDALEISGQHGPTAVRVLRRHGTALPVAASPFGNWLFFVRAHPENAREATPTPPLRRWHSDTSWIPLPPTTCTGAAYHWQHTPASVDWHLPPAREVYRVLRFGIPAATP